MTASVEQGDEATGSAAAGPASSPEVMEDESPDLGTVIGRIIPVNKLEQGQVWHIDKMMDSVLSGGKVSIHGVRRPPRGIPLPDTALPRGATFANLSRTGVITNSRARSAEEDRNSAPVPADQKRPPSRGAVIPLTTDAEVARRDALAKRIAERLTQRPRRSTRRGLLGSR